MCSAGQPGRRKLVLDEELPLLDPPQTELVLLGEACPELWMWNKKR